jgi:hypothetical protein
MSRKRRFRDIPVEELETFQIKGGGPARPLLTFAKWVKRTDPNAKLGWYSHLHLLYACIFHHQRPNVHGGYFEGVLSQQLIYRLACLGYEDTVGGLWRRRGAVAGLRGQTDSRIAVAAARGAAACPIAGAGLGLACCLIAIASACSAKAVRPRTIVRPNDEAVGTRRQRETAGTDGVIIDARLSAWAYLFLLEARQMGPRRIPIARLHAFSHRLIAVWHAAGTVQVVFAIGDALPIQLRAAIARHLSLAWGRNKSEGENCTCDDETHYILPISFVILT